MAAKPLAVTVLAAGEGRRFHSSTPKVLHRAAGLPLLHHVLRTVHALAGVDRTIVVAGAEKGQVVDGVRATWPEVVFVDQASPLGTAHALAQCEGVLQDFDGDLLVIPADTPLLRRETLQRLLDEHRRINADVTLLTACLDDPTGYGRVLRGFADGRFRVVEEADAGPDERAVREVSTGIWCFDKVALFRALERVGMDNAQGEYYLPDGAWVISEQGGRTHTVMAADPTEVRGVNDRAQLAEAARELRARHLGQL
ncbi:MAG: NTP transferase domain-containing protein, partial [Candidatus Methylomirabilales bacterium]